MARRALMFVCVAVTVTLAIFSASAAGQGQYDKATFCLVGALSWCWILREVRDGE
jgi:hypothetical protein